MTYSMTITKKGQVTIPKKIREALGLDPTKKVNLEFEEKKKIAKIKAAEDFLEFARKVEVKKKVNPVKARQYMERNYETG